jgi:hypothetical protein
MSFSCFWNFIVYKYWLKVIEKSLHDDAENSVKIIRFFDNFRKLLKPYPAIKNILVALGSRTFSVFLWIVF